MSDPRDPFFDSLYRRHYRRIVQFFAYRGFTLEESEDLAQQVFQRAYEKRDTLHDEKSGQAWIFAVAINVYRNEIRRRKALKNCKTEVPLDGPAGERLGTQMLEPGFASVEPDPRQTLLDEERSRRLRAALKQLPPRMRLAVYLRIEKGLKYREIAERMGVSVDTIKAQLHQARLRLRELLADAFDDDDDDFEGGEE